MRFSRHIVCAVVALTSVLAFQTGQSAVLTASFSPLAGTNVDLSAEGKLDWAHWGLASASSFDHKALVTPQISNFSVLGTNLVAQTNGIGVGYTWTNGTPTASATNSATAVFVTGVGDGFRLELPADTTLRRLKLHTGAAFAQAKINVHLSDSSAPDASDTALNSVSEAVNGVFTILYAAASPAQTLTLDFTALATYDAAGHVSLHAATLATNIAPTVSISSPTNNATFFATQNITVQALAQDADGSIAKVEFFAGPNWLGETTNSPYSVVWETVPAGTYSLTAVATDNEGGTRTSGAINITVLGNTPPFVAITNPVVDAAFLAPASVSINVSVADPGGSVGKVEFFADGNKIGEATNSPFSFTWNGVAAGMHTLTALATDNLGASAESAPVTIFVTTTGGTLTVSVAGVPQGSDVDLTGDGTNDWVHWGRFSVGSLTRKAGVASRISNYTPVSADPGEFFQFGDNLSGYSWSDGTPFLAATNTTTGVFVARLNAGFQLTVPATTNLQRLNLYVGSFGARGKLLAYLSDFTAPIYLDSSLDNLGSGPGVVYSLNYAAALAGQTVVLRYTAAETHTFYGNVTLQAATLSTGNRPPTVTLTNPPGNAAFRAPANVTLGASPADADGTIAKVEFYQNGSKVGERASSPYTLTRSNLAVGSYQFSAKATDNGGESFTSTAQSVFVINAGGFLSGRLSTTPSAVDLTGEGQSDWTHWALVDTNSLNRKRNVPIQISNYTKIGGVPPDRYTDNLSGYSWSNGTPTLAVAGTTTGLYKRGLNEGFQISLPADTTLRRLKVYVGVFLARGRLEATLSDSSAMPYIDTSLESVHSAVGVYTLNYAAASAAKTLTVKYTSSLLFDDVNGNVTLQAAAVANPAPVLQITNPLPPVALAFSLPTELGLHYVVEFTDSLSSTNWLTLTNFIGDANEVLVTDPNPTWPKRFYRVRLSK